MNVKELLQISKENVNGFTLDPVTGKFIENGFCVAVKETQNSFNEAGAEKVLKNSLKHKCAIGGWFNSENGLYYFDSVIVLDNLEDAIIAGTYHEQIAIFNLNEMKEITL